MHVHNHSRVDYSSARDHARTLNLAGIQGVAISTLNTTHIPYYLYNTPLDASLHYLYLLSHREKVFDSPEHEHCHLTQ